MKPMLKRFWAVFSKPSSHLSFGLLCLGGFLAGLIFWGAFNTALEVSNTEEFCIGCHEMRDNVYQELQSTVHWKNNSGVRATCPDCHVPKNWTDKIARKMQASKEVWGTLFGTINTREKFVAKRGKLAQHEWDRMIANKSLECKNCHDYKSMNFENMSERGRVQMKMASERNQTCIDCHKGIAHELPEAMHSAEGVLAKLEAMATSGYKVGKSYFSVRQLPLFEDTALSKEGGQLNAATEVKILAIEGDAINVQIDAWRKTKGYGRVMFEDFGMNINEGFLTKEVAQSDEFMEKGESRVDDLTGLPWQKVSVKMWMRNASLTDSRDTLWQFAKATYDTSCSVCHNQPAENHFTANTWIGMFNGMLSFVNLDGDTQALVLKYLQKHSSDFSDANH
jgi:trimethylamine-N-oxide reductase cytochrome c-type subunit TorC